MRTLVDTPQALVEKGRAHFGAFKTPFTNLNILDADPFGWGLTPKAIRNLRLKEWQHFAIVTPRHFIGVALVNAKMLGKSWCYVYDRKTGALVEHSRQTALSGPAVPRELIDARFDFTAKGYEIQVENHLAAGEHTLSFDVTGPDGPPIGGTLAISEKPEEIQPLILTSPIVGGRVFYTHKVPCPVSGEYTIGDETFTADPKTDFALLDIHKCYYPYRSWWKWANFATRIKGKIVGANLTQGLHPDDQSENCIWHGNRISLLQGARFEIPEDIMQPWRITTTDDRADLTFTPQGMREETVDFKLVVSWYKAPLGLFSGTLKDDAGTVHKIKDVFGIAEHHRVTW